MQGILRAHLLDSPLALRMTAIFISLGLLSCRWNDRCSFAIMSAISSLPKKSSLFEFPEVRVVEASAGSGKTYALAKRYVQLVLLAAAQGDPEMRRQIVFN